MLFPVIRAVPPANRGRPGRERQRALQALAREAVRRSAARAGLELETLEQEEDGAPRPCGGGCWSLSHKPEWVAGVAAPAPVGIDLEAVRPLAAGMYAKTGRPEDWDRLGGRTPTAFFRLWTAKEAVLKAVGIGLRGLDRCHLVRVEKETLVMAYDDRLWTVRRYSFAGHLAAVTAAGEFEVAWEVAAQEARS